MATYELKFDKIKINPEFISEADLQKFAAQELAVTAGLCVQRNLAGRDADGGSLKSYSASYKEAITRATRGPVSKGSRKGKASPLRKKGGNTNTTLRLTGALHESYGTVAKPIPMGAEIALPPQEARKAGWLENLGFKNFFAIGKEDDARIEKNLEKLVDANAEKLVEVTKS